MKKIGGVILLLIITEIVRASSAILMPVDLENMAKQSDEACRKYAPSLNPGYMEAFKIWKERLDSYYPRYQDYLYRTAQQAASTSRQYEEFKTSTEKMIEEKLKEFEHNPTLALERCRASIDAYLDQSHDAELKKTIDKFELKKK